MTCGPWPNEGNGPAFPCSCRRTEWEEKTREEDPIRLKNAVGGAKERLVEAGYPKDRAAEMLEPANDLIASRDFWLHQSDGLAVFATPDLFEYYECR